MVLGAVASIFLSSVSVVSAGVIMSETAITSGPIGHIAQQRTIYIQGNKQRVDTADVQTITDLDKRLLYIVDKNAREYVEEALQTGSGTYPQSGETETDSIVLKRTGKTQLIAYQRCSEYRGTRADQDVHVTVSACVSDAGPGVQEIERFNREMISQIIGSKVRRPSEEATSGFMLEKQSVVQLRRPYKSRHHRGAPVMMKSKIDDIKLKQLPVETFMPPKGFNKVNDESVRIPDTVESVAPTAAIDQRQPARFLAVVTSLSREIRGILPQYPQRPVIVPA
jgi:hypothetical protein